MYDKFRNYVFHYLSFETEKDAMNTDSFYYMTIILVQTHLKVVTVFGIFSNKL